MPIRNVHPTNPPARITRASRIASPGCVNSARWRQERAMRITIVGGGFSGVALAASLQRIAPDDARIHLVGVDRGFGGGVAYGEARPEHVLNVRARELGLRSEEHTSELQSREKLV